MVRVAELDCLLTSCSSFLLLVSIHPPNYWFITRRVFFFFFFLLTYLQFDQGFVGILSLLYF